MTATDDDADFDDFELNLEDIQRSEAVQVRLSSPGVQIFDTSSSSTQNSQPACHHVIDYDALATYVYPTNLEVRNYQYNIVQRAFYDNLLVALPTGLGKTFIASTVMLNFYRWFPQAKIIFMAPTRPLVAQQIKACCGITGIPTSSVAILLDKTRRNRAEIWKSKSVFFTTPQVVENDLAAGLVNPKSVSLLVIDEAHRARGNYAYNNVAKFLNRFNQAFRILALTATPASDVEGVQEVIDNLAISKVEVRTEQSIDISMYMKRKRIERVTVGTSLDIKECEDLLADAIAPVLKIANERKIYDMTDPRKINAFLVLSAQKRILADRSIPEGLKWANFFVLQLLNVVGQCLRRLNIYGIKAFYDYFVEKHREFTIKHKRKASKNKNAVLFYFHPSITALLDKCKALGSEAVHPKLEVLMNELAVFGEHCDDLGSRAIIFTEFRLSALDIVNAIERFGHGLKPHIFIGQAKEKDKFDEEAYLNKGTSKKKTTSKGVKDVGQSTSELAQTKGMSQKIQKDIVKKFRLGEFNVLVATSIGEEGLDIGEVDLIVCYDSTSSPIKNIQRMGRTGRKRDGKVLLLFAGNEELKFDKAMSGYEYIQKHIMEGKMITLLPRNRIIPKQFKPIVDRQFIMIPEENNEIREENDEDEIIRIATTYMTQGNPKKLKKRTATTAKVPGPRPQKQFFMPDNVVTGFRTAHQLVDPKEKSVETLEGYSSPGNDTLERILQPDDSSSESEVDTGKKVTSKAPEYVPRQRTGASLGVRKGRQPTLADIMLDREEKAEIELAHNNSIKGSDAPYMVENILEKDENLDDGLDCELLAIANTLSSFGETGGELYPNEFSPNCGFLNEEQRLELYTSHYTELSPKEAVVFYDPQVRLGTLDNRRMAAKSHIVPLPCWSMKPEAAQKLIDQYSLLDQGSEASTYSDIVVLET